MGEVKKELTAKQISNLRSTLASRAKTILANLYKEEFDKIYTELLIEFNLKPQRQTFTQYIINKYELDESMSHHPAGKKKTDA